MEAGSIRSNPSSRIAVISDQAIFLRGLVEIIQSFDNLTVVGEGQNGVEGLQLCQVCEPDIAIFSVLEPANLIQQIEEWMVLQSSSTSFIFMLDDQAEYASKENDSIYFFSKYLNEIELRTSLQEVIQNRVMVNDPQDIQHRFFHRESPSPELTNLDLYMASTEAIKSNSIVARELEMAGKIQKDILPEQVPDIPGWDISAILEPARETSGDFYDFIPLTEHKWGIVIADVIDKGMGAALFMALSSTLIRTYASRFPTLPAITLNAVSNRILKDTRGGMFVTAVYCVLEPITGRVIFSNAGHPPGFLIHPHRTKDIVEFLRPTGMALGVSEEANWKQKVYRLNPDDILVFYTDGVTEAETNQGVFFGEERIVDTILSLANNSSAKTIQNKLLQEVDRFLGNTPRQDDVAIIVIRRLS